MRPNWITCLIAAGLLMAVAVFATAQDVEHGRISYVDNDGLIRGGEDAEWSVAQQNSLVMPGDTIWADEQGVLEVEVSGGTFVRLADGSKMDVVAMPPSTHIKGWSGSFYIHRLRYSEGDVSFETPVGTIMVESNSQVRIDVLDEGSTTVSTRWGNAVIHTADGLTVRVPTGQQVFIDPGYAPSSPVSFDRNVEDAFDTWNRERSRRIAKGSSSTKIARVGTYAAPIGTYDLEDYGEWVYIDNQSYWRPTVVVDYVPYRVGSWSYVPNHGHVWVGHHPFTYITSHHGYWSHHHSHGWIWSYNHAYSPAYVASVRFNDNFIWAPLSIHGDAVHIGGSYFTAGGFHFSIGYTSYTHSNYILSGHHYSIYAMNHHNYFSHGNYYDAHHWNVYDSGSHHYRNRPHRLAHGNERHYRPQRYMRGPSEVQLARGGSYSASSRVARLESRTSRREFETIAMKPNRSTHRTSTILNQRTASTRTIRFNENPVQKIAQRDARVRSARVIPTAPVLTNRSPRNRGGVSNPSVSPRTINRSGKPSTTTQPQRSSRPTSRTINPGTSPGSVRRNDSRDTRTNTLQRPTVTPRTPRRSSTSGSVSSGTSAPSRRTATRRPQATTSRPSVPTRPQATTPRRPAPTRPQATTPRRAAPTRPQATTPRAPSRQSRPSYAPRQSAPSRPQATAPRQSVRSRPQATTPRAPSRQQTTVRQSRPSYTPAPRQSRPQASAPRQSTRQSRPQASAPRQSTRQSRPQASAPRPSAPSQSRVSAPRPSAPSVSRPSPPPSRSSSGSSSSHRSSGGSRRSR